ncbi:hypothetical protein [Spiroplasma poulsonii]|uniref:hypothetical protein n=1 Tax=Spiroplasma poulsonii TaxID=2138 RepID=UPI001F4C7526|nr:hypothetical protein [Spiroplasma poulsonii]UNF61350.1 hypothetical protein MNU24_05390 [Spiroplasma poulsonii]
MIKSTNNDYFNDKLLLAIDATETQSNAQKTKTILFCKKKHTIKTQVSHRTRNQKLLQQVFRLRKNTWLCFI